MLSNLPASLAFCTTIKVLSLRQVSDVFVFTRDYYDISERKKQLREENEYINGMYIYLHETHLLHKIFLLLIFFFTLRMAQS